MWMDGDVVVDGDKIERKKESMRGGSDEKDRDLYIYI